MNSNWSPLLGRPRIAAALLVAVLACDSDVETRPRSRPGPSRAHASVDGVRVSLMLPHGMTRLDVPQPPANEVHWGSSHAREPAAVIIVMRPSEWPDDLDSVRARTPYSTAETVRFEQLDDGFLVSHHHGDDTRIAVIVWRTFGAIRLTCLAHIDSPGAPIADGEGRLRELTDACVSLRVE